MTPIFMRIWLMKITSVLARLQAGQLVAHFALDFGARRQRGDRVDDDAIDAARAHQHVRDFEALFAGVGLRDQQVRHVHAELCGIAGVQRVFRVDVGGDAAGLLDFGDDVQAQRGLAGRLRPVDLHHPAARQAADAQSDIEAQRAGGNGLNVIDRQSFAHLHDGALAELFFDLGQGGLECLALVLVHFLLP
jgi:hypothetical protein